MTDEISALKPDSPSSSKQVVILDQVSRDAPAKARKGLSFWLIFLAICVSLFLSALEFVGVPGLNILMR